MVRRPDHNRLIQKPGKDDQLYKFKVVFILAYYQICNLALQQAQEMRLWVSSALVEL